MEIGEFERLMALMPKVVDDRIRRVDRCVLGGREVIEIVVVGEPLRLVGRTPDAAVEALQRETQEWAVSQGAPPTFLEAPVLYRTKDCCESAANKSEDFEVWMEGSLIASALAEIRSGKSCRVFNETRSFAWEILGQALPPDEAAAILVNEDDLPTGTDAEIALAIAQQREQRTEQIENDPLDLVGAVILLSPLFSAKFSSDYAAAMRDARAVIASIPRFDSIWKEFDDDERDSPVDYAGYGVLSDAGDQIAVMFRRLLLTHFEEWLGIVTRASINPASLGLEPTADNFLPDRE